MGGERSELWEVRATAAATAADSEVEETLYWFLTELGAPHVERRLVQEQLVLRGYLSGELSEAALQAWAAHVREHLEAVELAWQPLARQDWQAVWRAQWQPIYIGEKLVIWPEWIPEPPADRLVIPLDPGMAFGTGEHPTTRLCLGALEKTLPLGRFADIGCGCGVLTIAALKLGASFGYAVDTDPLAVASTQQNLKLNALAERAEVRLGSSEQLNEPVDGVVSNILAEVILDLAPEYRRLVRPGGWGIFSGLLTSQAERVRAGLAHQGFVSEQTLSEGDWACLVGRFS